ncbi:MAG: hypothetical protein ACUVXA_00430 [Candidatus Jordarchaeum sp.]|uniref:hypothetical protein n=1 Tax=Candidatus Jordarchaeum sp. TaxID=2823881 RepID=UPI0040497F4A
MGEFLTMDLLNALRDTPFPIERRADFIKSSRDEVLKRLGGVEFDEIVVREDYLEAYQRGRHVISVVKSGNLFYVRNEMKERKIGTLTALSLVLSAGIR